MISVTLIELTVTLHVAVFKPSVVVTVIVALPIPLKETTPDGETIATFGLLDAQATVLSVASVGFIVAISVTGLLVTVADSDVWSKVTPFTAIEDTVTRHVAEIPLPSFVVAVIVAVPIPAALTTPLATVAMVRSLDVHFTDLSEASAGEIVGVNATGVLVNVNVRDV